MFTGFVDNIQLAISFQQNLTDIDKLANHCSVALKNCTVSVMCKMLLKHFDIKMVWNRNPCMCIAAMPD